jgi:hypothetical protein
MTSVIFVGGKPKKKKNKLRRICRWVCNSFSRRTISYIEPAAHTTSEEYKEQPQSHSIALGYPGNENRKPVIRIRNEIEDDQQTQARYPTTRLSHPIVESRLRDHPTWDYRSTFAPSTYPSPDLRAEAQSPDYDAPRVQGRPRLRKKSAKNKDLPGPLRAQPLALTQQSLELNERRHSSSSQRLIDQIPESPHQMVRRWSNTYQEAGHSKLQLQQESKRYPANVKPNTLPLWNSFDKYRHSRSRKSHEGLQILRGYQPMRDRSRHPQPAIVPLSNDHNRVLVHSKSRGFKVVRNLLSIEKLRDMVCEQPRHVASLERMAEDDRNACQELSSK